MFFRWGDLGAHQNSSLYWIWTVRTTVNSYTFHPCWSFLQPIIGPSQLLQLLETMKVGRNCSCVKHRCLRLCETIERVIKYTQVWLNLNSLWSHKAMTPLSALQQSSAASSAAHAYFDSQATTSYWMRTAADNGILWINQWIKLCKHFIIITRILPLPFRVLIMPVSRYGIFVFSSKGSSHWLFLPSSYLNHRCDANLASLAWMLSG